jgi:long-chain-acyl-CoA dehydrogenase
MPPLDVPRPAWMTEDVVLLEEQARRFIDAEFVPHLERWNEAGIYDRDVWLKAGAARLLCASMPEDHGGGGGSFAHEAAINRALSGAGFDAFGAPLHSGIVAPYILHFGTAEQKRRWLPRLATGELVGAIAMTEPGAVVTDTEGKIVDRCLQLFGGYGYMDEYPICAYTVIRGCCASMREPTRS